MSIDANEAHGTPPLLHRNHSLRFAAHVQLIGCAALLQAANDDRENDYESDDGNEPGRQRKRRRDHQRERQPKQWLQEAGGLSEAEMRRTFNCGVGGIVVCAPKAVEATLARLAASGETAHIIGDIVSAG